MCVLLAGEAELMCLSLLGLSPCHQTGAALKEKVQGILLHTCLNYSGPEERRLDFAPSITKKIAEVLKQKGHRPSEIAVF